MRAIPLNRSELQDMHSVLRRSLERAERRRAAHPDDPTTIRDVEQLARAVADLDDELADWMTGSLARRSIGDD